MSSWAPRVFWKAAEVEAVAGGYTVRLDGRAVKTPAKAAFTLPTAAMAEASAAEWRAQEKEVLPQTMPVTRAANAAIDKVTVQFDEVAEMLAGYGDADLTCYRADAPDLLVARQATAWDPLLDWAQAHYGARLEPVAGVMHAPQDAAALARLAKPVYAATPFELTALHDLISLSGSLVIGLAAAEAYMAPEALWERSRVDEIWQAEQWGEDPEAAEASALKRRDFLRAHQFLDLCRSKH